MPNSSRKPSYSYSPIQLQSRQHFLAFLEQLLSSHRQNYGILHPHRISSPRLSSCQCSDMGRKCPTYSCNEWWWSVPIYWQIHHMFCKPNSARHSATGRSAATLISLPTWTRQVMPVQLPTAAVMTHYNHSTTWRYWTNSLLAASLGITGHCCAERNWDKI